MSFSVASVLQRSAVGHLNADGYLDVVIAASDEVMLMFSDQAGSFSVTHFPNSGNPSAAVIGDFNEDGMQDIAVAEGGYGWVDILTNRGSNVFELTTSIPGAGSNSYKTIATGDFNEDGHVDLVALGVGRNFLLLGNGDGTFASISLSIGQASSVVAADLDGDGHVDLAMGVAYSSWIHFIRGLGNGTFEAPVYIATAYNPNSLTLADMDGNGTQDLLAVHYSDGLVSVLLNDGLGAFTVAAELPTGLWPSCVRAGDLNNDGRPDIIAGIAFGDQLNVFMNETPTTGVGDGPIAGQSLTLSPNPVRRGSTIELRGLAGRAIVSVFDVTGRRVVAHEATAARSAVPLPQRLAAGVYTVRIESGGRSQSQRIVVLP